MSSNSRAAILTATKVLIARNGPGVSLAEVAAEAGVSRQALYMHFGSRAGLLVSLVRSMDEEANIREKLQRALESADSEKAFRGFVREWLRFATSIQPVASMLFAARDVDSAASAAWEDRAVELRGGFKAATRRLSESGLLRAGLSAETAADMVWAICSMPVVEQLVVDLGWRPERVHREMTESALRSVVIQQS